MLFQKQAFLGVFNQIEGKLSSSRLSLAFTSKASWKIICTALIWAGLSYRPAATKDGHPVVFYQILDIDFLIICIFSGNGKIASIVPPAGR